MRKPCKSSSPNTNRIHNMTILELFGKFPTSLMLLDRFLSHYFPDCTIQLETDEHLRIEDKDDTTGNKLVVHATFMAVMLACWMAEDFDINDNFDGFTFNMNGKRFFIDPVGDEECLELPQEYQVLIVSPAGHLGFKTFQYSGHNTAVEILMLCEQLAKSDFEEMNSDRFSAFCHKHGLQITDN